MTVSNLDKPRRAMRRSRTRRAIQFARNDSATVVVLRGHVGALDLAFGPLSDGPISINAALRSADGARFFGDGDPWWRQGDRQSPCKTLEEARNGRRKLINALRRGGSTSARVLANKLAECRVRIPCLSGACPVCGRAGQRLATHVIRKLIRRQAVRRLAVTIISDNGAIRYGLLRHCDLFRGIAKRLHEALSAFSLSAVGGLDVSGNEHAAGAFASHFMPHAHILVQSADMIKVHRAFRAWFPRTARTPRPIRMVKFDGALAGIAYLVKADVSRRITSSPKRLPDGTRSTFGPREKAFFKTERVEIAIALDHAGLDARLFLHGYGLVVRNGDFELSNDAEWQQMTQRDRTRPSCPV